LPADLMNLTTLSLDGNPLTTFVLPEPLAVTRLFVTVANLRSQGVFVYTYPLARACPRRRVPNFVVDLCRNTLSRFR
jgi:hypothetical protein